MKKKINRSHFTNFEEAAEYILEMLSKQMDINTLFIAKNDGSTNTIIKAHHQSEKSLVEEGSESPFQDTYCSLSIQHGDQALVIEDLTANQSSNEMKPTKTLGKGSFIGIPVYYEDGSVYGTICGLDQKRVEFTSEHIASFEAMSSLLSYVLELEKAKKQIRSLSAPLVPVTRGVAILPIIGEITAERAQNIIEIVMVKCQEQATENLIIDVSGVSQINTVVGEYLLKLVSLLKLVGIVPVITGIQPFMAIKIPHFADNLKGVLIEANLETALKRLGLVLKKEEK
ncbi:MAG TPA: STAS domain-containing protein [Planococcus sp. (in: firmicutes)]|nr:STAS domain-containing protein [Planococcus sp. (in: firmicutes)]